MSRANDEHSLAIDTKNDSIIPKNKMPIFLLWILELFYFWAPTRKRLKRQHFNAQLVYEPRQFLAIHVPMAIRSRSATAATLTWNDLDTGKFLFQIWNNFSQWTCPSRRYVIFSFCAQTKQIEFTQLPFVTFSIHKTVSAFPLTVRTTGLPVRCTWSKVSLTCFLKSETDKVPARR